MRRDAPWLEAVLGEATESAVRAQGPGGQHVNKTSTAVVIRLDVEGSAELPAAVKARLRRLAGRRLSQDGVLALLAQDHRSLEMNRRAARERLTSLLLAAARPPRVRRPTAPPRSAAVRRRAAKSRRGAVKGLRARPVLDD